MISAYIINFIFNLSILRTFTDNMEYCYYLKAQPYIREYLKKKEQESNNQVSKKQEINKI